MESPENKFAAALRSAADERVTIELLTIWRCFYTTRPELKSDITSRQRLAADLRTLAEHGIISMPASKSSFDRTALPALPRFVRLLTTLAVAENKFDYRTFPWSLPMSFVAGLTRLPNPAIAQKLNDFFRGDWASRIPVPVKERSYEIFANEKALEKILDGQFGHEGRLTLETLRCYRVPLVPVHRVFSNCASDVLIVENEATFDSVSRWNTERRKFRMIIYGRGREAEKIADFLLGEVRVEADAIYYFGDLDRMGIVIPYRLSRTLKRRGDFCISPAAACYRLLLKRSPATITMDMVDELDDPADKEWIAALGWLPEDVRVQTEALLAADRRIAQEATGWELFRMESTLI